MGMYNTGMMMGNMGMDEFSSGSSTDWILIAVIAGSIILGIVLGIVLGKKAMKKRDI